MKHKPVNFTFTRKEPYITEYGEHISLLVWTGNCISCGDPFEIKTSARVATNLITPRGRNAREKKRCRSCVNRKN